MPNPLQMVRDWSRSKEAAKQLFASLQRARPGGVDVPRNDPELAAGLMALLKDKRFAHLLTVVKNKKNLTLAFKEDVDPTLQSSLGGLMKDVVVKPGEDVMTLITEDK